MDDIFRKMGQKAFGGSSAPGKRPACTSPNRDLAPKKKPSAAKPTGLFQGQQASPAATAPAADADDESRSPSPPAAPQKEPKIPALFLDSPPDWPLHAAEMRKKTEDFEAFARPNGFRLQAKTVIAFRHLQRYLYGAKLSFYTHSFSRLRNLKVVISGLPTTTEEELSDALTEERFAVQDVARLRSRRGPSRSWLVILLPDSEREEPDTKRAAEIYNLQRLYHCRVKISPYRRPAGPPQCYRCQAFGHGSSNCNRPKKCVRCGGPHDRRRCDKPAGEKGDCCNCEGQHNASYRGCPAFQEAKRQPALRAERELRDLQRKQTQREQQKNQRADSPSGPAEDDGEWQSVRPRKKRKRPPRNPANRQRRSSSEKEQQPQEEPEDDRPAPQQQAAQRPTPRRRINWPPRSVSIAVQTEPAQAEAPATAAVADVAATLAEIMKQLTAVTTLLTALTTSLSQ